MRLFSNFVAPYTIMVPVFIMEGLGLSVISIPSEEANNVRGWLKRLGSWGRDDVFN